MERSYHLPNNVNCGAAPENFQKKIILSCKNIHGVYIQTNKPEMYKGAHKMS